MFFVSIYSTTRGNRFFLFVSRMLLTSRGTIVIEDIFPGMIYDRQYRMAYEVVGGRSVPRYTYLYPPAYSNDHHYVLAPIYYDIMGNTLYLVHIDEENGTSAYFSGFHMR